VTTLAWNRIYHVTIYGHVHLSDQSK